MKRKKILLISLIVFIILFLTIIIFLIYNKNNKKIIKKYKVLLITDLKKETKEVIQNDILKLENKTKDGYVFKGWKDSEGKLYNDKIKVFKNFELIAIFEKKENINEIPEKDNKQSEVSNIRDENNKTYYCDKNFVLRGKNCIRTEKISATSYTICPNQSIEYNGKCKHVITIQPSCAGLYPYGSWKLGADGKCHHPDETPDDPNYTCPGGYDYISGNKCQKIIDKIIKYTCPNGYVLNGTNCIKEILIKAKIR